MEFFRLYKIKLDATDEIEAGNAPADNEPVSSFTPLDDQIDAALANNDYGQDLQTAMPLGGKERKSPEFKPANTTITMGASR